MSINCQNCGTKIGECSYETSYTPLYDSISKSCNYCSFEDSINWNDRVFKALSCGSILLILTILILTL